MATDNATARADEPRGQTDRQKAPKPKTYRALKRTWLSHESRHVEAGQVFTTEFPQVPKMVGGGEVVSQDGRLVVREPKPVIGADGKPEMEDMHLGDNIELVKGGDAEVSGPAIGTEHGDKKPDMEAVMKSAQDHIDRQRASLPSPGLPRLEGAEPQRAMDGPPTRDTDDDRDARKTPAAKLAEDQQAGKTPRGQRG
jgi:hypothetical protein